MKEREETKWDTEGYSAGLVDGQLSPFGEIERIIKTVGGLLACRVKKTSSDLQHWGTHSTGMGWKIEKERKNTYKVTF